MEILEFKKELEKNIKDIGIEFNDSQIKQFYNFMNLLIIENQHINLTAITDPKEIILKHFIDSLTISKYIEESEKTIDIGTGAGFPGIPNAIYNKSKEIYLLDSLNKRIDFLNKVKREDNLENLSTIWGRAEDIARLDEYREKFDIAVSRAVAPLNVLVEYLIPFVKVGGKCICMKGPNYKEEMQNIDSILKKLGGKILKIEEKELKGTMRVLIIIEKTDKTDIKYPRRAGIPSKKPLR